MLSLLPSGLSLLLVARPYAPATPSSRAPVSSLLLTPARLRVLREPSMQESGGEAGAASAVTAAPAYIEFMVGVPEPVVPDVKLTRSRDGTTGVATFTFDGPSFLLSESADLGETTGMYLKDEEGTLKTTGASSRTATRARARAERPHPRTPPATR